MWVLVCNALVSVVWGVMPHVNKWGLVNMEPAFYAALRLAAGLVVLVVAAGLTAMRGHRRWNSDRAWVAPVAGLFTSLSILLYAWAIQQSKSPSAVTSFIYPASLALSVLFGRYLANESLQPVQLVGVASAVIACACLTTDG